ncbi:MAG: sulfate ABC transporter permease subunit CysT [Nitrospinae bacterium]|nr:sulfate ABC transporter permease subunit CysT [Nitrospinota bacterium]
MAPRAFNRSPLPGFSMSMGFTLFYLGLIVLIPVSALFIKSASIGWEGYYNTITDPRGLAAYKLSFGAAFAAAVINAVFGVIVAWVMARYKFPGKKALDAMVDLPFALPTAVAGIALTTLYTGDGWFGRFLEPLGLKVAFTPVGIVVALVFIGLPFVVRTVQPVIEDLEREAEEAAACLGATRWTTFTKVIFPEIAPALLTGFALAFARGIGEYGSVIFIAGNMPMVSEIAPLLIVIKLEQYDYGGATAYASVMLVAAFLMLLGINFIQWFSGRRFSAGH